MVPGGIVHISPHQLHKEIVFLLVCTNYRVGCFVLKSLSMGNDFFFFPPNFSSSLPSSSRGLLQCDWRMASTTSHNGKLQMQPDVYNPIIGHGYLGKNMIDSSLSFLVFLKRKTAQKKALSRKVSMQCGHQRVPSNLHYPQSGLPDALR